MSGRTSRRLQSFPLFHTHYPLRSVLPEILQPPGGYSEHLPPKKKKNKRDKTTARMVSDEMQCRRRNSNVVVVSGKTTWLRETVEQPWKCWKITECEIKRSRKGKWAELGELWLLNVGVKCYRWQRGTGKCEELRSQKESVQQVKENESPKPQNESKLLRFRVRNLRHVRFNIFNRWGGRDKKKLIFGFFFPIPCPDKTCTMSCSPVSFYESSGLLFYCFRSARSFALFQIFTGLSLLTLNSLCFPTFSCG